MKFNIINLLYLFFRLAPIIVVSFFSLQFVFNYDYISIIYLIGLIIAILTNLAVGNVFNGLAFKNRSNQTTERKKELNMMCKVFELTKDGPISNLPLSQTVLSYSFFFLLLIIIKNNVKTLDWSKLTTETENGKPVQYPTIHEPILLKNNIPFFIVLPILIIGDMFWNIKYECDTFQTLFISLIIGGLIGLLWARIIELTYNSRYNGGKDNDNADIGVIGNSKSSSAFRKVNNLSATYSRYASGAEIDVSLFNVINNNICDQQGKRTLYKCRNISNPTRIAPSSPGPSAVTSNTPDVDKLDQILTMVGAQKDSGTGTVNITK